MREFQKTGIYPQYLVFYSKELGRRWKHKISGASKKGTLSVKGETLFQYEFDGTECSVTEEDGYPVKVEMCLTMKD